MMGLVNLRAKRLRRRMPPDWELNVTPRSIEHFVISPHAAFEMERRGLSDETVRLVLSRPEQEWTVRPGRVALQSRVTLGEATRTYLIRVVADVDRDPAEVVTAYRTSKISKYWREDP
jgi:hypothetical protein